MELLFDSGFQEHDDFSDRLPSPRSWQNWGIDKPQQSFDLYTSDSFLDDDQLSPKRQRFEAFSAEDDLFFSFYELPEMQMNIERPVVSMCDELPSCSGEEEGVQKEGERFHQSDYSSPEELALQSLTSVLENFSRKTRISFRDALFRLAENARRGEFSHNCSASSLEEEMAESGTNKIDRAVASLMFNRMEANLHGRRGGSPLLSSDVSFSDSGLPIGTMAIPSFGGSNHSV